MPVQLWRVEPNPGLLREPLVYLWCHVSWVKRENLKPSLFLADDLKSDRAAFADTAKALP